MPELVNPFGLPHHEVKQPDLNDPMIYRPVSMEVDKDTMSASPVFEAVDSQKEIDACRDLCGLEYMKKLLASGQVTAEELQDNSGSNVDLTMVPENVHDANAKANELNRSIAEAAKEAGAKDGKVYTQEDLEELITAKVRAVYQEAQAKAAAQKEGAQQ